MIYYALVDNPHDLNTVYNVIRFDDDDITWEQSTGPDFTSDWEFNNDLIDFTIGTDSRWTVPVTEGQARAIVAAL